MTRIIFLIATLSVAVDSIRRMAFLQEPLPDRFRKAQQFSFINDQNHN